MLRAMIQPVTLDQNRRGPDAVFTPSTCRSPSPDASRSDYPGHTESLIFQHRTDAAGLVPLNFDFAGPHRAATSAHFPQLPGQCIDLFKTDIGREVIHHHHGFSAPVGRFTPQNHPPFFHPGRSFRFPFQRRFGKRAPLRQSIDGQGGERIVRERRLALRGNFDRFFHELTPASWHKFTTGARPLLGPRSTGICGRVPGSGTASPASPPS